MFGSERKRKLLLTRGFVSAMLSLVTQTRPKESEMPNELTMSVEEFDALYTDEYIADARQCDDCNGDCRSCRFDSDDAEV